MACTIILFICNLFLIVHGFRAKGACLEAQMRIWTLDYIWTLDFKINVGVREGTGTFEAGMIKCWKRTGHVLSGARGGVS